MPPEPLINNPVTMFLIIVGTILIAPLLSKQINLPNIIGLILGGVLIGQHGLNLLGTGEIITLFSEVGLIYLMFNAGLEINLQQLEARLDRTIVYAGISFILPQASGIIIGRIFGLDWLASILLGTVYASQTLLSYQLLSNLGIIKNQAIAITVGATVFTDIAALLVLAVVTSSQAGEFSTLQIGQLIAMTILYAGLILFGVPKLGNLFFKNFEGNVVEFQFILVIVFAASYLAHLINIHPIVGAFLAGLAINRTLSEHSRAVKNALFVGNSFFIPLFLITVGMRLDFLAIFSNTRILILGAVITAAVYLTKFLASWITAKIYNYSKNEMITMWGLSQAQAAATLATILVGTQTGVFDDFIFDAAILGIIFTSLSSPIIVKNFGKKISTPEETKEIQSPFNRILLPITSQETQEKMIDMVSMLTRYADGTSLILNLAENKEDLKKKQESLDASILNKPESKFELINRLSDDFQGSIQKAVTEENATMVVFDYQPDKTTSDNILPSLIENILWNADVSVLAAKLTARVDTVKRLDFIIASRTQGVKLDNDVVDMVENLGEIIDVPINILASSHYVKKLRGKFNTESEQGRNSLYELHENYEDEIIQEIKENDLVILSSMGSKTRFKKEDEQLTAKLVEKLENSILLIHHP